MSEFTAEVLVHEPSKSTLRLYAASAMVLLAASYVGRYSLGLSGLLAVVGMAIVIAGRASLLGTSYPAKLTVKHDALVLRQIVRSRGGVHEEDTVIPRASIARAYLKPGRRRGGTVVLEDASGKTIAEIELASDRKAHGLVPALGLDATKQRMSIPAAGAIAGAVGMDTPRKLACLGVAAAGLAVAWAGIPVAAVIAFALLIVAARWPGDVDIAADGISFTWLNQRRFVPFGEIVQIRDRELLLASGERLALAQPTGRVTRDVMVERMREAFDAFHARGAGADVAPLLSRGDRSAKEWLDHLRALRDADYRTRAIREEDLWRIVEDPAAPEDARAGAAALLRSSLDDDGRARIRVASETTASPRLRVALDATVEAEDDASVEQHLAAMAVDD